MFSGLMWLTVVALKRATCNEAETHSENLDSISKHDNGKEPAARSGIRAVLRPWGAAVSNGLNAGKHDIRAAQAEVVKERSSK